ncbi:MAG: hypothetical protein ACR2N3_14965 [Pyrinomonadaceae bacterium]
MKPKTIKIIYWSVTILFAVVMLMDGIAGIMQVEAGREITRHSGITRFINSSKIII